MKKYNFNAGPSILPQEVIKQTADAVLDFQGEGLSILEISHRAKYFQPVVDEAEALMKELLGVPEGYRVIFLGGGASLQFCMVPYNMMGKKAAYLNTGVWSKKALKEAKGLAGVFGAEAVELAASEVAFQHSLDIQSCSTTQYRALAACHNVIVGLTEILKIAVEVVSFSRLSNINKVIGNLLAVNFVVSQVLACSDIHTAIHLTGVSGKYLATDSCCQLCGNACLAAGCRTCYDNEVIDTGNA